jgi:hypothetical protein
MTLFDAGCRAPGHQKLGALTSQCLRMRTSKIRIRAIDLWYGTRLKWISSRTVPDRCPDGSDRDKVENYAISNAKSGLSEAT